MRICCLQRPCSSIVLFKKMGQYDSYMTDMSKEIAPYVQLLVPVEINVMIVELLTRLMNY